MLTVDTIPKKFKIANQWYTVEIVDHLEDADFGDFNSARAKIRLARKIYSSDEYVELSNEQICNSFWHELFHAFNFHMNCECDETLAQSFANFMREFETNAVL